MSSFDSILVRLKVYYSILLSGYLSGFDSILVRLKVYSDDIRISRLSFDSILVRLKVPNHFPASDPQIAFRFHTGSIKSRMLSSQFGWVEFMKFRFHTGSIKRASNMHCQQHRFRRFDSILVRLKDKRGLCYITLEKQFRFHTGSIKSGTL